MKYLPTPEDVEEHLPAIISGELSEVARQLNATQENLERLLAQDPAAIDLVRSARDELEALLELRLLTLAPTALDTLEMVLHGRIRGKEAMAGVQAAREVLDRNAKTAKVSRNASGPSSDGQKTTALPALGDLLDSAPVGDHMAIVDRYMGLMSDVDALRSGKSVKAVVEPGEDDEG